MYMHMYMVAIVTERNTIVNSSLATINLRVLQREQDAKAQSHSKSMLYAAAVKGHQ